jgi:ferric-dicitrate binding protein FerR (iron transport regulator)/pimeloyl-ACP methyl ester carboxylesterase
MSEDRLERALQELKEEDVAAGTLEAARTRVWQTVTKAGSATCAEFRQDFRAYLGNELGGSRRMLVEDHLSRCPACRARIAEMKGERPIVAMPRRSSSRWVQWGALAAAAALLFAVLSLGRDAIDAVMAPGGPRATVVSADGGLYRLASLSAEARSAKAEGPLEAGAAIGERESVRTGPGARAVLRLADGSLVDVNERTELFVTAAWSGQAIHLQRGDVIVKAAKQRRGRLRVLTRDSIASVKGTVFAVSAGMGGSVVSVVEGSVAVDQPGRNVVLSPGQQAASIPALASSVAEAVSWSPEAEYYVELLGSLAKIERELANFPTELRTNSALLSYLPAGAVVYGTVPNPGVTIGRALALAEDQSAKNAAFSTWWNSESGRLLIQMADRLQAVNSLLGDEIVFCASLPGGGEPVPMVMARVQPGKRASLMTAVQGLVAEAGDSPASYSVSDDLMVVSSTPSHLAWTLAHLGQGAGSPFAAAIAERYRRGVGWLIAIDAPPLVTIASEDDAPPIELAGMMGMKYLFLEQRAPAGAEENEVTFAFQGARTGMGSWLADAGSGGAAEYLPADALVAGYVSTREPMQLFEEFTAQITRSEPDFEQNLATMDEKLGAGFIQNLTAALGTEAALAVTGLSVSGPTWVMAGLVNNPTVIDSSLQKLAEAFNAELGPDEQGKRIVFGQEDAGGRTWNTMKPGGLPLGIVWTYDRGYMVAASDRGVAERAIATRNGGSPLVWSPEFLGQLPSSAGLHPSAFGWLNAKGALGILSALAPSPALNELLAGRDPILVVFDGTPERIHAASRTRVTGLIMDVMLLESLGRASAGQQTTTLPGQ